MCVGEHKRVGKHFGIVFVVWTTMLLSLFSCIPEQRLAEGECLLVKNKVSVDKKVPVADDLVYVVRPQPNKRTLGLFWIKVSIFQAMQSKDKEVDSLRLQKRMERRKKYGRYEFLLDTLANDYYAQKFSEFKVWMQDNFGEEPVLLDTTLIAYSKAQLRLMMANNGYFNSRVSHRVKYGDNRAKVFYDITAGEPYTINEISYRIQDSSIATVVYADTSRRSFRSGDIYSVSALEAEQKRLSNRMLNRGYFYFSQNYVRFEVDSNFYNNTLNVCIVIDDPKYKVNDTTIVEGKHRLFKIDNVTVFSDWEKQGKDKVFDYYEISKNKDTSVYTIHYNNKKDYFFRALVYPIFFRPGDMYSSIRSRITYDNYVDMKNFDFVKLSYTETPYSKENYTSDTGYLDCRIQLSRSKRHSFDADVLLKDNGSRIGFGGNLTLTNKNTFRGGELLSVDLKYMHEIRADSARYNNFEVGATIGLEAPSFWFPISQNRIPKSFRPKTHIQIMMNFMRQDLYDRFLINTAYTYRWRMRMQKHRMVVMENSLSVMDFNLIKMYTDDDFAEMIAKYKFKRRTLERYKDHFILGSIYSFTLQNPNKYQLRARVDVFGNLMYAFMSALGSKAERNSLNQYTIWKIPLACGVTFDADYVHYLFRRKKQSMAFRFAMGVGVPMLNSTSLPFEKSFYLGGSNSMRGWRLRGLGPGGYADTSTTSMTVESVGDVKLELNLEYRFQIYKVLHGAVFADVGNIWLIRKQTDFPNGEFAFNRFYKELAFDFGLGLRVDLSFFVIRLDYALKIHNPAKTGSAAWQYFKWRSYQEFKTDRAIVLGIGYPF